mgnify:CR=1 FL=1
MVTANNGAASEPHASDGCDTACRPTRWGYVESGVAGLVVLVVIRGSLPMWWEMTRPFGLFSTTVIATLSVLLWISVWAGLSLFHERVQAVR